MSFCLKRAKSDCVEYASIADNISMNIAKHIHLKFKHVTKRRLPTRSFELASSMHSEISILASQMTNKVTVNFAYKTSKWIRYEHFTYLMFDLLGVMRRVWQSEMFNDVFVASTISGAAVAVIATMTAFGITALKHPISL